MGDKGCAFQTGWTDRILDGQNLLFYNAPKDLEYSGVKNDITNQAVKVAYCANGWTREKLKSMFDIESPVKACIGEYGGQNQNLKTDSDMVTQMKT